MNLGNKSPVGPVMTAVACLEQPGLEGGVPATAGVGTR